MYIKHMCITHICMDTFTQKHVLVLNHAARKPLCEQLTFLSQLAPKAEIGHHKNGNEICSCFFFFLK